MIALIGADASMPAGLVALIGLSERKASVLVSTTVSAAVGLVIDLEFKFG